jgi:hypothetical protein
LCKHVHTCTYIYIHCFKFYFATKSANSHFCWILVRGKNNWFCNTHKNRVFFAIGCIFKRHGYLIAILITVWNVPTTVPHGGDRTLLFLHFYQFRSLYFLKFFVKKCLKYYVSENIMKWRTFAIIPVKLCKHCSDLGFAVVSNLW